MSTKIPRGEQEKQRRMRPATVQVLAANIRQTRMAGGGEMHFAGGVADAAKIPENRIAEGAVVVQPHYQQSRTVASLLTKKKKGYVGEEKTGWRRGLTTRQSMMKYTAHIRRLFHTANIQEVLILEVGNWV